MPGTTTTKNQVTAESQTCTPATVAGVSWKSGRAMHCIIIIITVIIILATIAASGTVTTMTTYYYCSSLSLSLSLSKPGFCSEMEY